MSRKRVVGLAAAVGIVAACAGVGAGQASAASHTSTQAGRPEGSTISFSAKRETVQQIQLGPKGSGAGAETLIGGRILTGNVRGFTSAQCVTISAEAHGISQCQVDLLLGRGTITTLGVTSGSSPVVKLAVVGGTGRYSGAAGSGTLEPTQTGSKVLLHLQ